MQAERYPEADQKIKHEKGQHIDFGESVARDVMNGEGASTSGMPTSRVFSIHFTMAGAPP